jgi:hypothetical protein
VLEHCHAPTLATSKQAMEVYFYDIITDLPPSQGFDAILTVVDRFIKMAHFLPCVKSISSQETVEHSLEWLLVLVPWLLTACGLRFLYLYVWRFLRCRALYRSRKFSRTSWLFISFRCRVIKFTRLENIER